MYNCKCEINENHRTIKIYVNYFLNLPGFHDLLCKVEDNFYFTNFHFLIFLLENESYFHILFYPISCISSTKFLNMWCESLLLASVLYWFGCSIWQHRIRFVARLWEPWWEFGFSRAVNSKLCNLYECDILSLHFCLCICAGRSNLNVL